MYYAIKAKIRTCRCTSKLAACRVSTVLQSSGHLSESTGRNFFLVVQGKITLSTADHQ